MEFKRGKDGSLAWRARLERSSLSSRVLLVALNFSYAANWESSIVQNVNNDRVRGCYVWYKNGMAVGQRFRVIDGMWYEAKNNTIIGW